MSTVGVGRLAGQIKLAFIVFVGLVVAFGATTWWALESGGVAVVETMTPEGTVRSTHVWYVEPNGELWLEAGARENAWFQDLRSSPALTFKIDGRASRYIGQPVDTPAAHLRIRSLLRERYGFRDWWVSLVADTSRSVAVRLVPADGTNRRFPYNHARAAPIRWALSSS